MISHAHPTSTQTLSKTKTTGTRLLGLAFARAWCNNSDFQPPDLNVLAYTVPGEQRASPERGADAPFLPMRAALAQGGPNISTPRRCWWADSPWRGQRLASSAQAQHV